MNQSTAESLDSLAEVRVNSADVQTAAKNDPDFLSAMAMPSIFVYLWPPVFKAIWAWLLDAVSKSRSFLKLAIGLPRGFGKTTLIKLFVLFIILFTNRKFILIISNTATLAENIVADIAMMLDELNIKQTFGNWRVGVETDNVTLKKFGFRGRNIIIAGIGQGGSVRGLNIHNERPDIIIFEDIQTKEQAESQVVSEDMYKWMLGTAMKAKSPKGCLTVFIANMYPTPHSILKKLKANPYWDKFIAGGLIHDETGDIISLWEELQPRDQLLAEFAADEAAGHPEIFYSEVMNDEHASVNNLLDFNKLPEFDLEEGDIPQASYVIIDPSNDKANSDAVSLGYFEVHNLKPYAWKIVEGRFSPLETIRQALILCRQYSCKLVAIESNAYQATLKFWCDFVCKQMGIEGIYFVEIYSGTRSKNSRILDAFKELKEGKLRIHPDAREQVRHQVNGFRPLKPNNVDGILDLLAYASKVMNQYENILSTLTPIGEQAFDAQSNEVYSELANSAF